MTRGPDRVASVVETRNIRIKTPRVYVPLLAPGKRYRGLWGGRGSGKSWFAAELLVDRFVENPKLRAVCVREFQKSLEMSAKRLIEDVIKRYHVSDMFRVLNTHIETPQDGIILFQGMANHTAESIKSLEGFSIAWCEEAQSLSQKSLDMLRPTIREEGSEIWATWNPSLATDPIDQLLRSEHTPPDSVVVGSTYADNPFFPEVLRKEMEWDKRRDPEKYQHIWRGGYQRKSEARVFKNWRVDEFETPADAVFYLGADWGFSIDPSVMVRCFVDGRILYIDREAYRVGVEIDHLPQLFDQVPGARDWVVVADSARPETISYLNRNGFPKMIAATKGPNSVKEGVSFIQNYDIIVHPRCIHVIDELTNYAFKVDKLTGFVTPVLADKKNHCIAEGVLVTCADGDKPIEQVTIKDRVLTRAGYKRVIFSGLTDIDRETVIVETTQGVVYCTPDHEIYTSRGFVQACDLHCNDAIIGAEHITWLSVLSGVVLSIGDILTAMIGRIGITLGGLFPAVPAICIETYGSITTDQFQKDTKSTTKMKTQATTASIIWSALLQPSTKLNILTLRNEELPQRPIWNVSDHSQKNGIDPMQDTHSTNVSGRCRTIISILIQNRVNSAKWISYLRRWAQRTDSVLTSVNQRIGVRPEWMMKIGHVASVIKHLWRIATRRRRLVHGAVLTVICGPRVARVYDLTVEDQHEFFANGVLVSNCIDSLRYAVERLRAPVPEKTWATW